MGTETNFRLWRKRMGVTQSEAAELLRVSRSQVANYDAGKDRVTGRESSPPYAVRKLMALLIRGEDVEAWNP